MTLTTEQQALLAIRKLKVRVAQLEMPFGPVAVTGLAHLFPCDHAEQGYPSSSFWNALRTQRDCVSVVPRSRWDIEEYYHSNADAAGKMNTRYGGFLQGVDVAKFDAAFFGISPGEARSMDPQQRLVLECVWHALENAGYKPENLRGSRTGVFLGISTSDYQTLLERGGPKYIDPYRGTGTAHSAAAGRVSYVFGFQGPCKAIDTACSSSLYALHDAVASLQRGECDLAVVAGVNLLLSPDLTIYFSKGRFMAPDGHCKTFDASANGYVRGEGCGVVLLKRQSDAEKDGDRVRALVRGTAVNQDGRSSGLTVPNGPAQEAVIREALERAQTKAADIDYVEAHGTGTQLGDPIEMNALANVYMEGRSAARPLLVGSVKTNIGHLEAASGMAGLIKLVLSLEQEEIPAQLHFATPNRNIEWGRLCVSVATRATPWKRTGARSRLAGISAFAFQGSNAHVILEEAPLQTVAASQRPARSCDLLVLSSKTAEALPLQVARWAAFLESTTAALRDVADSALRGRTHFAYRLAVVGTDCRDVAAKLRAYERGEKSEGLFVGDGQGHDGESSPRLTNGEVSAEALAVIGKAHVQLVADAGTSELMHDDSARRIDIPYYAFHRKAYWTDVESTTGRRTESALLGACTEIASPLNLVVFDREIRATSLSYLGEYRVFDLPVFARTGFVELVCQAWRSATSDARALRFEHVDIEADLPLEAGRQMQVVVNREDRTVDVFSRPLDQGEWTRHAHAQLASGEAQAVAMARFEVGESSDSIENHYRELESRGLSCEPEWRRLRRFQRLAASDVIFEASLETQLRGHWLHPVLLETCFQPPLANSQFGNPSRKGAWLPSRVEDLQLEGEMGARWCVRACTTEPASDTKHQVDADTRHLSVTAYSLDGNGTLRFTLVSKWSSKERAVPAAERRSSATGPAAAPNALIAHLLSLDKEARLADIERLILTETQLVVGDDTVNAEQSFKDLGFDSLMSVELRDVLVRKLTTPLASTVLFDYPNARQLALYICDTISVSGPATPVKVVKESAKGSQKESAEEAIAVIGLACRYPGGANTPEAFWQLMVEGQDAIEELPPDRWDERKVYDPDPDMPGKSYCKHGGFLHAVDQFDPSFFGISSKEASSMDPQQRLLLETSYEAMQRAGLRPDALRDSATGVYVGLMYHDYLLAAGSDPKVLDGHVGTGSAGSVASGRLSYVYGFQGPSMTVDTACSSSLVTTHLAMQALRNRECDLAFSCGVTVMTTLSMFIEFSRLRGLAKDGRCKSFSEHADGVGWAEGCGVLLLKRLSDAQRDGDRVLAVLRSSSVNQDGHSNGLTAPNGPSQQRVIESALQRAGLSAKDIDYVEAHGTGTTLGDPIEAGSLIQAYGRHRAADKPVLVGSVKSNIGHAQAAAGIAGVMKVVLALQNAQLPGSLHAETPSKHVEWKNSGVELLRATRAWTPGERKRFAGVSSFGISGTNVHVIVEEAPDQVPAQRAPDIVRPYDLVVASAKSEEALRLQVRQLADYLEDTSDSLRDIAHTALTRRTQFEHRIAVVAKNCREAAALMKAYLRGENPPRVIVDAKTRAQSDAPARGLLLVKIAALKSDDDWLSTLTGLAHEYVQSSLDIAGAELMKDQAAKLVGIPTYAFDRKRFWFGDQGSLKPALNDIWADIES